MSDRERILAQIRGALGRGKLDAAGAAPLAARLQAPTANRLPAASRGDRATLLHRFAAKVRRAEASLVPLETLAEVPQAVAQRFPQADAVRLAPHPDLASLAWPAAGLAASSGPARADDRLGVSRAYAAVAESGTLVLCSGPASPTTLNFLPDCHVVVVHAADVAGSYEAVWARLREAADGTAFLPRTVNWITGPSRTADIEQTLYLGIHGPRQLHVLLVGTGLVELLAESG